MKKIEQFIKGLGFWVTLSYCMLLGFPFASAGPDPQAGNQPIVIRGGTLIDGTGREPIKNAVIVIEGNKIKTVTAEGKTPYPTGSQMIDATGKTIIPGLMDLHVHLGSISGNSLSADDFNRQRIEENLRSYLFWGVTAVRSLGFDQDLIFRLREEERKGEWRGARVFTAGQGVTAVGAFPAKGSGNPGAERIPNQVGDAETARKRVASLAAKKVDLIKIWVDDRGGTMPKLSPAVSKAIIDEAHKHKLVVAAHIADLDDAKELARAGVDGLAHLVRNTSVDDELIRMMKAKNIYQVTTLAQYESTIIYANRPAFLEDPGLKETIPLALIEKLRSPSYVDQIKKNPDWPTRSRVLETGVKNAKKLADAGVKIVVGTDGGPSNRFPGFAAHRELELLVEAGLTPLQAIVAGTRHPAEHLGISGELGTIQPGKVADLIILEDNPLQDIKNTRRIHAVMKDGQVVDRKALVQRR